ncbi:hypothetical protein BDV19DRAFT_384814 [Aspergillus venezuelensis]
MGRKHTLPTILTAAWTLLLSQYTDSSDVVFGLTVNGRKAPLPGIEGLTGPMMATVPFRLRITATQSVQSQSQLDAVQEQITTMTRYEQYGLQSIRKLSEDAARACDFQTHFAVQSATATTSNSIFTKVGSQDPDYQYFASYPFVFVCQLSDVERHSETSIEVNLSHDSQIVPTSRAQRMVEQFEHIVRHLIDEPKRLIQRILGLSPSDMNQVSGWNASHPESHDRVLHELVSSHASRYPDHAAICAWDGHLNYNELQSASLRLAMRLLQRGVKEGFIVPSCFEKSKWAIVTMLAVLSIGAALVCIDPKHPQDRLRNVLDQVKSSVILVSPELEDKIEAHKGQARVLISPLHFGTTEDDDEYKPSGILHAWTQDATQMAFIIFTSGSTGQPKGILMEHRHMATSIQAHTTALSLTSKSRVLHFASFAFDASLYEIFACLVNGGCVCIPSEEQRMNGLKEFMAQHSVNWTLLTPSMLALLDPDHVPCLQTMVAGGEALTRYVVDRWASGVVMINAYGPGETIMCAAGRVLPNEWRTGIIGPILVTSGYFNRPDLTTAGLIDPPVWLVRYRKGKPGRVFRSGDLVQLTESGWVRFIGRKGTQVKVRGQRIELSDVKYHVRQCFECHDVVVESISLPGTQMASVLVAFVMGFEARNPPRGLSVFDPPIMEFGRAVQAAENLLSNAVPEYMVPSLFLPMQQFPQTTGGKVDRRRLRHEVSLLSPAAIARTEMETIIQMVWAHLFNRDPADAGVDVSFFHLGGESISAMQLVLQLNSHGVQTTVAAIFGHKTISRLAEAISQTPDGETFHPAQRSPEGESEEEQCGVVFELSPMQQLFLHRVPTNHHHFNQSVVLAVKDPVSVETIKQAIDVLVRTHPMLRALFKQQSCGEWQQVVKSDLTDS